MAAAGLLLAGGAGRRMGEPKALVRFRGVRLVTLAVQALTDAGCAPVTVVLGARADEARAALREGDAPADLHTVVADGWDEGMGASLRRGLEAVRTLRPLPDAVLVHLVDLPGVTADAIRRTAGDGDDPSALRRAAYDGRAGHPVLIGRDHWDAVTDAASGDEGARSYLGGNPAVQLVECGDLAVPDDVDTPEQLARLAARTAPPGG
ncbi:nucleotidyltransferase family protein [Pseudonocardia endophytica]|uniref:Nicotine blue oxidoreductase n=1 Tax=Pseudonocardia endophytica TaxID=401976 RepID=A0A4R1HDE2_PSEEN|nr:nucleotidyltransferase family protein [Pseudonocardia endophytica]TCK20064.1 nicotine blue oxidoreductase [Pseudonocardia endophytica]